MKKVELIEARRAYNVSISLARVHLTAEDVKDGILRLDGVCVRVCA